MVFLPNWDAVTAIIIPNVIGFAGALSLIGQISNENGTAWFQTIKKPSWVIPNWSYGIIFTIMYTCLGYASYLVYLESTGLTDEKEFYPRAVYAAHLAVGVLFSIAFYKLHKLGLSFFILIVLDGILIGLTVVFYLVNPYSVIFLLPLQAWQTYATFLTRAVWTLNDKRAEDCQILKA